MNEIKFIEKVEKMGLHVEHNKYFLHILDKSNFELASISKVYKYQFRFYQAGICNLEGNKKNDFINLVVEYVCSPEREQEKKYCLRHKYMIDSYGTGFSYLGVDRQTHSTIFINSKHDGDNVQTAFTLNEILELKKKFDTDFSDFEIEEYGVSKYEDRRF